MIVSVGLAIVAAGPVTKINLVYQSFVAQKAQRVVNGRKADTRHFPARRVEHLGRRRMMMAGLHHLEHHRSLPRESRRTLFLSNHQSGIIIILKVLVKSGGTWLSRVAR